MSNSHIENSNNKMNDYQANNVKVSVIMNCFNSERYLKEAIDSIYSQKYKNWEIIFFDNASTDKSGEIAKSYDERLKYFKIDKTIPLGSARNMAIEKATGEYITFLDCDDIWLPQKLEKQIEIFEKNPDFDFSYTNYFILKNNNKIKALKGNQPQGNVFEQFLNQYPIAILTTMIRRKALDGLDSLFDKNLNLAEEYDVFMRLLYRVKAFYVSEPSAVYRIHSNMTSMKLRESTTEELLYCIEKFKKTFNNFEKDYSESINNFNIYLAYSTAKTFISKGDLKSTRKQIKPYMFSSLKFFLIYILTFLPRYFSKYIFSRFSKSSLLVE